jgi:hypothetical protein
VDVRSRMDRHLLTLVLLKKKTKKIKAILRKKVSPAQLFCLIPYNVEEEEAPHTQKIDVSFFYFFEKFSSSFFHFRRFSVVFQRVYYTN